MGADLSVGRPDRVGMVDLSFLIEQLCMMPRRADHRFRWKGPTLNRGGDSKMRRGNLLVLALLALALLFTGVLLAQKKPAKNVSPLRHPNLAADCRVKPFKNVTVG